MVYDSMIKVIHQVVGQKLLLAQRSLAVRLDAQQQVVATSGPRVLESHIVNDVPVGGLIVGTYGILHASVNTLFNNVSCFCCTVVVKEIITINLVLW